MTSGRVSLRDPKIRAAWAPPDRRRPRGAVMAGAGWPLFEAMPLPLESRHEARRPDRNPHVNCDRQAGKGVAHSLQSGDGGPLDPQCSNAGEPLAFDFTIRVAPGPKFFGEQVRREGPERRFIYVRIGQMAGDLDLPWTRRMKIDIHDIGQDMLDRAALGGVIETRVCGTASDGSPACATVKPTSRQLV